MLVQGFKIAAIEAELRYKNRFDLSLIVSEKPCVAAGVFTKSVAQAAPVIWSKEKLKNNKAQAILVNAGQANAQTGETGLLNCQKSAKMLANLINCTEDEVLLASTGIIGQNINMPNLEASLPKLVNKLAFTEKQSFEDFALGILTTDTFTKTHLETIKINGETINIWGVSKGSGMIAPNMATMLAFILTDANIEAADLNNILLKTTQTTFNRITVDGDTSTNDTVLALASGACGPLLKDENLNLFHEAFLKVMGTLARKIVKDGEGANHLVEINVRGAQTPEQAHKAARTVAQSPLVKTALFGRDANWGRILAALGRSGAEFNPYKVDIDLNEIAWIRNGIDNKQEAEVNKIMALPEYTININLNAGLYSDKILTCDFSHEYVTINSDYRS